MLTWLLQNRGAISFFDLMVMFFSYAVLLFVMLPAHELAHAWAAHRLGDDTAKWNGRLRFDPLRHLDPMGAVMIVLFGIGYARPVPINPYNFKNPKRDMALSALAGPVSNLLMAVASVGLFRVCCIFVKDYLILQYLQLALIDVFAGVNISLAVFNLLPIPPLDGSKIFGFFLPDKWVYMMEQYSRQISMVLMLLLFTGVLDVPLSFLRQLFFTIIGGMFGF